MRSPAVRRANIVSRSTSPAAGSTNVSRSTQVTVRFSEAIDSQQLNAFKLVGPKGEVAGAYSFDNPFTVRLRPQQRLDPSSDYQIVVERSVQDEAGKCRRAKGISGVGPA